MVLLYMVTFTINIPPMLAYIPAPWILWVMDDHPHPRYPRPAALAVSDLPPAAHLFVAIPPSVIGFIGQSQGPKTWGPGG